MYCSLFAQFVQIYGLQIGLQNCNQRHSLLTSSLYNYGQHNVSNMCKICLFAFRHTFQAQILDKEYCQAKKVCFQHFSDYFVVQPFNRKTIYERCLVIGNSPSCSTPEVSETFVRNVDVFIVFSDFPLPSAYYKNTTYQCSVVFEDTNSSVCRLITDSESVLVQSSIVSK